MLKVIIVVSCLTTYIPYPDLWKFILYNLLENALFFSSMTRAPSKNHIMASMDDDNLFISVYDNGIGIDEKIRFKLWDMFFVV